MSKDEKIWIPDNYYQGFLRGCLANELIEETPSKTALENSGCQISALCYLILPNGSQHNPRVMKPNEFPTSIRKLFEIEVADIDLDDEVIDPKAESEDSAPVVTDPKTISNILSDTTSQVCEECNQQKPIEAFAKMRGRGVRRQSVCIECQTKTKLSKANDSSPTPEAAHIPNVDIQDAVVIQTRPTSVTVTLDYLKRLATEAYMRGREYERSNTATVEPSLDELLGIGA